MRYARGEIRLSSEIQSRGLKVLLWGPTASRKTETILRHFPRVLLIDCEGNSDQCINMPEVPPFLQLKTKDVYEINEILDKVAAGEVLFPDGSPVETVGIDGFSVLWSVRQEAGSLTAEHRAQRERGRNYDPDKVHMTQYDWVIAKRPLKRLYARLNNPGVKYVVLTAREKDLWEEVTQGGKTELKKTGVTMDAMRGIDYEVNIAFQMFNDIPWKCQVVKVQGALGTEFPLQSVYSEFPYENLLAYATGNIEATQDEIDVAESNVEAEEVRTQAELIAIGRQHGLDARGVANALKDAGFESFDASSWSEMVEAVITAAA